MKKNIVLASTFLIALSALVMGFVNRKNEKFVYVDMGKVYSEFRLAKELNASLEQVLKTRRHITDSLFADLQMRTQNVKTQKNKSMDDIQQLAKTEEEYYYKQQQFEKDNQAVSAEYNSKILNQLNQYIADYGKEHHYSFLFGATGQGNIMYADQSQNITQQVIDYVNNRYDDKIKK